MRKITIGDMDVPVLALGCMRMAELSVTEAERLIDTALEQGITLFDHADIYGGGRCESLFGDCLRARPSLRGQIRLQSKCGIRQGYYDLSARHILQSVDSSLARLGTDYLDIFLLHRPDALMEPEEIAQAFERLLRDGKVRCFGVSNMNPAQIDLLQSATQQRLVVNQMQLSLACSGMIDSGLNANVPGEHCARDESVIEYCRRQRITIQAWSPLQYGLFKGVFLGSDRYPRLNDELAFLSKLYDAEPAAIAIAWILRHPAHMQAILGSANCEHIRQMAKAADITLSHKEWYGLYCAAGNALP